MKERLKQMQIYLLYINLLLPYGLFHILSSISYNRQVFAPFLFLICFSISIILSNFAA